MIRASLPLVIALWLSSCALLDSPGIRRGGDCRPDIGPGGLLKIASDGQTRVAILKTPIENGSTIFVAKNEGDVGVSLDSWAKYTLEIDFGASPVSAALRRDGAIVLDLEKPAVARRTARPIVLTDRNDANLNFNSPGTLKFFARNPNNGNWYVATAHLTQKMP